VRILGENGIQTQARAEKRVGTFKSEPVKRGDAMYSNASSNTNRRSLMAIMPYCAACYNFLKDEQQSKKSVWLVPHVIKHKDDSELISWRCNWGNVCQSECIYAMARERGEKALGVALPA
jgi:hypothetical protein